MTIKLPLGKLAIVPIVAWVCALPFTVTDLPKGAWAGPTTSWQPVVALLPLWSAFVGIPSAALLYGLWRLIQNLWRAEPFYISTPKVKLPIVPKRWSRLSSRERYAECQREIARLELDLGIGHD